MWDFSYGTFLGQTYANLFPRRVRAMLLDAIVDQVEWVKSAEARTASVVRSTDPVFALCQRAGAGRCALAGHSEPVAQRVARLFGKARRAPIPAPHANPPGELTYSELLLTTFVPLRALEDWPRYARDLDAAATGDASALETAARGFLTPETFSKATTSAAIQCLDGPARQPVSAWPKVMGRLIDLGELWAPFLGWAQWAPCASNWPAHSSDRYAGPWNAKTTTPILLINNRHDPADDYRNAKRAERRLGNAVLLTEDGYGHPTAADPSDCVDKWRVRYLVDLVTPPRGTICRPDKAPFS